MPQTDVTVDAEALSRCLAIMRRGPAGLFTDIDGTISPVAARPQDAIVLPGAREALRRLQATLALVAVVTGRAASSGEALVGLPGLTYVGNHGLEWRSGDRAEDHQAARRSVPAMRAALAEIANGIAEAGLGEGLIVEDKRLTGSLHYRLAPDRERAHALLLRLAREAADRHGLRYTEGRLVIELRPLAVVNKGTATADLIAEHRLRAAVFLGDDTTDVDAFLAIRQLREAEVIDGLRVGVVGPEAPRLVYEESDVTVPGVAAAAALLAAIADEMER